MTPTGETRRFFPSGWQFRFLVNELQDEYEEDPDFCRVGSQLLETDKSQNYASRLVKIALLCAAAFTRTSGKQRWATAVAPPPESRFFSGRQRAIGQALHSLVEHGHCLLR
jgi:hypothetical protein